MIHPAEVALGPTSYRLHAGITDVALQHKDTNLPNVTSVRVAITVVWRVTPWGLVDRRTVSGSVSTTLKFQAARSYEMPVNIYQPTRLLPSASLPIHYSTVRYHSELYSLRLNFTDRVVKNPINANYRASHSRRQ
jgi:hypothetical protein